MDNTLQARQAYEMNLAGSDAFEIGEALSVTVEEAIFLVNSYGDSIPSPSLVQARRDEVLRCDVWLGRVNQEYLLKTIPIDKAVTSFCKLSERRAKLLGIDSVSRAEITALLQISPSSVDAEIASLVLDLGINDYSIKEIGD